MSREEFEAAVAATVARAPEPSPELRARVEQILRPAARRARSEVGGRR
ncbi:hypothetical protein [Brachybacterium aquaticum]|uniref:Uncharacterized protein n=1 Tax=Brachybacterium aquaticum TaxID=1432564 RepID=A0A841AAK6_9MICO|nr:hypothetical protein [Brachybacterium aquaticum]MBB5830973.1 hypothetical protein [Brachybacterium aquaticum]